MGRLEMFERILSKHSTQEAPICAASESDSGKRNSKLPDWANATK
jgi:hypothetical protein